MAYNPGTGQLMLFGGLNGTNNLADTWTWNGTTWTPQTPATNPPARNGAALAYNPGTGQLVLFGGNGPTGTGSIGALNDTWTWNGTTWTPQTPATNPPARNGAALAYDPATGQLILFGGQNGSALKGDTWMWGYPGGIQGGWAQQTPPLSPQARGYSSLAFDSGTGQLVLFGGFDYTPPPATSFWAIPGRGTAPPGPSSTRPPARRPAAPRPWPTTRAPANWSSSAASTPAEC